MSRYGKPMRAQVTKAKYERVKDHPHVKQLQLDTDVHFCVMMGVFHDTYRIINVLYIPEHIASQQGQNNWCYWFNPVVKTYHRLYLQRTPNSPFRLYTPWNSNNNSRDWNVIYNDWIFHRCMVRYDSLPSWFMKNNQLTTIDYNALIIKMIKEWPNDQKERLINGENDGYILRKLRGETK